jgi:hypothetical protein
LQQPTFIEDTFDEGLRDQIAETFLKGQKWSDEDQKLHSIIIQGPSSIDELYSAEGGYDTSSNFEVDTDEDLIQIDGIASKINSTKYSPKLIRKQSSPDEDSLQAIKPKSLLEGLRSYTMKPSDSFDENLNMALLESQKAYEILQNSINQ